jgi:importin subunit alpha-1
MAERYIPEHRRTQFKAKNTFKPEELRRRREEQQVEIRKAKREENLAKRRGIGGGDGSRPGASLGAEPDSDDDTAPTESQVSSRIPSSVLAQWFRNLGTVTQLCASFQSHSPLYLLSGGVAHRSD